MCSFSSVFDCRKANITPGPPTVHDFLCQVGNYSEAFAVRTHNNLCSSKHLLKETRDFCCFSPSIMYGKIDNACALGVSVSGIFFYFEKFASIDKCTIWYHMLCKSIWLKN